MSRTKKTKAPAAPVVDPGSPEAMAKWKAERTAAREVLRDPLRTIRESAAEIDRLLLSVLVDLAGNDDYSSTVHELAKLARENFQIRMAAADEDPTLDRAGNPIAGHVEQGEGAKVQS